jgi:hypothetical protein
MKYEIGDKILVLHSNEEGVVIDIINDDMVMIEVRGVKFPAYMDQIDFPYFKRFTEKKLFPEKKQKQYVDQLKVEKNPPKQQETDGVWISFFPKFDTDIFGDEIVEELKVYLVNKTDQAYRFHYKLLFFGKADFELENEIRPFADFYLHDVPFEDLNDSPTFSYEFSLSKPEKTKADFCEANFKIKPKQLFQRIEELKANNEPFFGYKLLDVFPDKKYDNSLPLDSLTARGFKVYPANEAKKHLPSARSVVDLHIEKITDDFKGMSNFEIVTLQLKEFEKWYDLAVAHRLPNLIVIHGVGKGKLKEEIHDLLKVRKEVKTFVNQYDPRFGFGATEIFFQY